MEIKLYNDVVFKWVFGRKEQTYPLICFLNAVVSYDSEDSFDHSSDSDSSASASASSDCRPKFSEVEILNPYDANEPFTNEKQGILDIRAKDIHTHEWIDLEVQVIRTADYKERSKYYLAGMYRDQLKKSSENNYDELRACYGIHLLVDSIFEEEDEEDLWFNHYRMLNVRTHQPLINHWNLYYVELNKFLKCFEKAQFKENNEAPDKNKMSFSKELELWSYFLGTIQDNSKPLPLFFNENKGIKEVFNMLQTFTKDDRLREQYRLHEEFIRVQRGEEARKERLKQQYNTAMLELAKERKAKEEALKKNEEALKRNEEERKAKEEALKQKEEIEKISIVSLRKAGYSNEEIANMLNISLPKVQVSVFNP